MTDRTFPGDQLRERRESLGISVGDVYEFAHVPPKYVHAFEAGSFETISCDTYALGFLRSYCRYLGLEPEPYVDDYYVFAKREEPGTTLSIPGIGPTLKMEKPLPGWVSTVAVWASVIAVLGLCWLTYSTITRPITETPKARVGAGTEEVAPPKHFEEDF